MEKKIARFVIFHNNNILPPFIKMQNVENINQDSFTIIYTICAESTLQKLNMFILNKTQLASTKHNKHVEPTHRASPCSPKIAFSPSILFLIQYNFCKFFCLQARDPRCKLFCLQSRDPRKHSD